MNLYTIGATVVGTMALALVVVWNLYQSADERADRAEAALATKTANEKVVTKYVDRILEVPGPERVRTVVDRVCHNLVLPDTGSADEATGTDPDLRPDTEGIAQDITACERNRIQLEALQQAIRNNKK